ncbi:MAG: hypothetical protein WBB08_08945 [Halobacteriota archaeon]
MSETVSVFDKNAVELLFQTRNLLDEVLETMDVLADEELMKAIRESEDAIEKGETRDLKDFVKELGLENYHLR